MRKVQVEGLKEEIQMENDTNMLIFNKADLKEQVPEAKIEKKKLTRKERIRLEKVVERKDKTSRVIFIRTL